MKAGKNNSEVVRVYLKFFIVVCFLLVTSLITSGTSQANSSRVVVNKDVLDKAYSSISVAEGGKKRAFENLVVSFSGGKISVKAGCNVLNGGYTISKRGLLVVKSLSSSKMACLSKYMSQDEWLRKFFTSNPKALIVSEMSESLSTENISISINNYLFLDNGKSSIKLREVVKDSKPPVSDEDKAKLANQICSEILSAGLTEGEAVKKAVANKLSSRVVARDGEEYPVTTDYSFNRINLRITKGLVVGCTQG